MSTDQGRELGWNDTIENDGGEWVLLPAGEYPFRVTAFERKRYNPKPGAKLPACNMASVKLDVGDEENSTTIEHNLYLYSTQEGLLCAFFRAIGARKHGEKVVMDWSKVVGATGRCVLKVETWTGRDGKEHESNKIARFLDPIEGAEAPKTDGEIPF
jgi:hypothetical protein